MLKFNEALQKKKAASAARASNKKEPTKKTRTPTPSPTPSPTPKRAGGWGKHAKVARDRASLARVRAEEARKELLEIESHVEEEQLTLEVHVQREQHNTHPPTLLSSLMCSIFSNIRPIQVQRRHEAETEEASDPSSLAVLDPNPNPNPNWRHLILQVWPF